MTIRRAFHAPIHRKSPNDLEVDFLRRDRKILHSIAKKSVGDGIYHPQLLQNIK
ncbi:MAG: hypothetical protein V7L20_27485 [Nostoc sp.]|uniref:hypothetical protein n=1 Tax=Nostoc sp. TaxID=1180 RepID=UPI002FFA2802